MTRTSALLAALFLGLALGIPALAGGQTVEDGAVVDEDYCFRLRQPRGTWQLLDEEHVKNVVPDAVAGAVSSRGVYGVVIVEPAAGVDLEAFARTILDNMPLEDREVFSDEPIEYLGRPAHRFGVLGKVNDLSARYRLTVFESQGFVYQVNVFSAVLPGRAWEQEFSAFEGSLALLEGVPRARNPERVTRDLSGAGWRVKDGVFESAAYELRVAPKAPWSLLVGSELRDLNADAVVGLQCSDPEGYVIVIAETYGGGAEKAFEAMLVRQFREGLEDAKFGNPRQMAALGEPLEFVTADVDIGIDIRFWYGVRILGGICYQIQGWFPSTQEDRVAGMLEGAIGGIERLDAKDARALRADVASSFASRTRVGPDHALRGGKYRDFTHDFTFTRPTQGYWKISTGQEARESNADCTLTVEELRTGMFGQVIGEQDLGLEPEQFHEIVVGTVWGDGSEIAEREAEKLMLDGIPALRHAARYENDGVELWYELVTLVHRDASLQLVSFGLLGNREPVEQAAARMRSGFAFPRDGLQAVERTSSLYTDHRLGFQIATEELQPPLRDATPANIRAIGSVLFSEQANGLTGYAAVCGLDDNQDESFFLELLNDLLTRDATKWAAGEPKRESLTWQGYDATKLTWPSARGRIEALLVWRDRTMYMVVDAHADRPARSAADRLTFLD